MTDNMTQPESQPDSTWRSENLKDYRRLRRSRADRKVAGVAGGLATHFNIDPTILRVLFVVLTVFGGSGILLYGALWVLVPEEHTERAVATVNESTRNALLIGAAVIAVLLALGETWTGSWLGWPLVVIGIVVAVVLMTRDRGTAAPPPAPAAGLVEGGVPGYASTPAPPAPSRPQRSGPLLFGITLALLALALGVLGLVDASGTDVADAAYPALALGLVGAMLVVGAFWGRPGGLVALGLVAALLLVAFSIGNPGFDGDRDRVFAPRRTADVADSYFVPAGRIELDLTRIEDLEALDGRHIELEANAGELVVTVPDGVTVRYDADVNYGGTIETPAGVQDGWSRSSEGVLEDEDAVAEVELVLDLDFGRIEVAQQ